MFQRILLRPSKITKKKAASTPKISQFSSLQQTTNNYKTFEIDTFVYASHIRTLHIRKFLCFILRICAVLNSAAWQWNRTVRTTCTETAISQFYTALPRLPSRSTTEKSTVTSHKILPVLGLRS